MKPSVSVSTNEASAANFATTRWTVILSAAGGSAATAVARQALENLCRSYWLPLQIFARRRGCESFEAQDAVQDFFLHVLEGQILAQADPQRGRFRTYLLRCFCNFLANRDKHAAALKRGGQFQLVPLDTLDLSELDGQAAARNWTPEYAYDIGWAHALVERVVRRLREEAVLRGKVKWFDEMRSFLPRRDAAAREENFHDEGVAYQAVSQRLGMSVETLRTAVHRLRVRFRKLVREEVEATVDDPQDADAELQHLRATLSLAYSVDS